MQIGGLDMTDTNRPLALITGASSGIGLELAKCFADDGYDLVIVAEDQSGLESVARSLRDGGAEVHVVTADLREENASRQVHERVTALGRNLDVFVNNAGVGVYGDFTRETALDAELDMIRLNVIAPVQLTKLFAPAMVERGDGKILITASVASITPTPLLTVYGSTKAFLYEFSEGLREELRDSGVTVTALMPGPTDTNFFARAGAEDSKIVDEKLADPASVARAGYDALMKGTDKVVTPLKYKVQTTINQVVPDPIVAKQSHKKHERKSDGEQPIEQRDERR
jgi:short-subunit dehydrogenase